MVAENLLNNMDRKSVRSCSEISTSSHRVTKCVGDFCMYNVEDEELEMNVIDIDTGNIIEESRKARERHKTGKGHDKIKKNESEYGENDDEFSDRIDEEGMAGLIRKKEARSVPYKSISLARQDMADIEGQEQVPFEHCTISWPEVLYHWWWRTGRVIAQRKGSVPVPVSSSHRIGVSMLRNKIGSDLDPIVEKDDKNKKKEKKEFKNEKIDIFNKSKRSGDNGPGPMGLIRKQSYGDVDDPHSTIPYDLTDNKFTGKTARKVGQMSWYYSDAKVCNQCYRVYADLNRRREKKQINLMKAHRKVHEDEEGPKGKDIEHRIFEQRKFVFKMSKGNQLKKKKSGFIKDNLKQQSNIVNDSSYFGYGESKFDQSHYQSQASQHHNDNNHGPIGAPKGSLPPLPWQLRNNDMRQQYENNIGSAFIKNMKNKADNAKAAIHEEKMMSHYSNKGSKILGGMLDGDSIMQGGLDDGNISGMDRMMGTEIGAGNADHTVNWKNATGQGRKEQKKTIRIQKIDPRDIPVVVNVKNYDATNLLHPWHREFDKLKKKKKGLYADELHENCENNHVNQSNIPKNTGHGVKKHHLIKETTKQKIQRSKSATNLPPLQKNNDSFLDVSQLTMGSQDLGEMSMDIQQNNNKNLNYIQEKYVSEKTFEHNVSSGSMYPSEKKMVSFDERSLVQNEQDFGHFEIQTRSPKPKSPMKPASPKQISHDYNTNNNNKIIYDDDDDDDDDEGIGWSPFVVST
jgi:hypothetical protein